MGFRRDCRSAWRDYYPRTLVGAKVGVELDLYILRDIRFVCRFDGSDYTRGVGDNDGMRQIELFRPRYLFSS